jgi:hypothetical protein
MIFRPHPPQVFENQWETAMVTVGIKPHTQTIKELVHKYTESLFTYLIIVHIWDIPHGNHLKHVEKLWQQSCIQTLPVLSGYV